MPHNGFLHDYQQAKARLGEQLGSMQGALSSNGNAHLLRECGGLREKLAANQFNLVVMGQFKRGKSTLINALLGCELLPVAVVPLTSVVTIVRYGERVRSVVHFRDGRHQEITAQDIAEFTTERGNSGNEKHVKHVEIEYPADFLCDGVRLIDTPGVGSVFVHNTNTAYEFLPQADAVLFLVAADPPISEAERQFLAEVREHAGKIFFVNNKIDHLSREEMEESLGFTREVLVRDLQVKPAALKIFPLSARWALEGRLHGDSEKVHRSQLHELERILGDFLTVEKGALLIQSVLRRGHRLLQEAVGLLALESKAIATPQAELTQKIAAFQQHQIEMQQQKELLGDLLNGTVRRILERYDDEVEQLKREKVPLFSARLRALFTQQSQSHPRELAAQVEKALREELEAAFVPWREQQELKVNNAFSVLTERLVAQTNAAIDRIYQVAGELFVLRLERYEREASLAGGRGFYFSFEDTGSALEDLENLFTYTFAALVSRKIVLKKAIGRLPQLFDRQCGRIRADFSARLRDTAYGVQGRLEERMDGAFREIQGLVERARKQHEAGTTEIARRVSELQRRQQQLMVIEEQLLELNGDGFAETKISAA